MHYPINEIFQTIQGEGIFTGLPAIFVRLQGCPVGCPWCDTRHTWVVDPAREVDKEAVLDRSNESDCWSTLSTAQIIKSFSELGYQARHVVITGGEPCLYDLHELSSALLAAGYQVQIETSGTSEIKTHEQTWVTVSPKIGMKGGCLCWSLRWSGPTRSSIRWPPSTILKSWMRCWLPRPCARMWSLPCSRLARSQGPPNWRWIPVSRVTGDSQSRLINIWISINMDWLSDEQVLLTLTNKMPYGKYQGRRIIDIPEPYLVWMARSGFPAGKLGQTLALAYEIKLNGLESMIIPIINRMSV